MTHQHGDTLQFGRQLRACRERAKKTLKDLAEATGLSVVYISDIERGRRNPPDDSRIATIATLIGTATADLIDLANIDRKRVELDIDNKAPHVEKAALMLARSWSDLTEEQALKILDILDKEQVA